MKTPRKLKPNSFSGAVIKMLNRRLGVTMHKTRNGKIEFIIKTRSLARQFDGTKKIDSHTTAFSEEAMGAIVHLAKNLQTRGLDNQIVGFAMPPKKD